MNRQQELEGMSDSEINQAVAKIRGCNYMHFNYTSNPSDIMPIATEHKIGSRWSYGQEKWGSEHISHEDENCIYVFDKNRLRAICIVFILMMEGKS